MVKDQDRETTGNLKKNNNFCRVEGTSYIRVVAEANKRYRYWEMNEDISFKMIDRHGKEINKAMVGEGLWEYLIETVFGYAAIWGTGSLKTG